MSTMPHVSAAVRASLPPILSDAELDTELLAAQETDSKIAAIAPVAAAFRLPWQRACYALALWRLEEWDERPFSEGGWGPKPTRMPSLICVIAANQIGKSTVGGMVGAAHLSGLSRRFPSPGHVWFGMPRLEDSVEIQRRLVEKWVPGRSGARWLPTRAGGPTTTLVDTKQGGHGRFKAYEQGLDAWESQTVQAIIFDEPPSDDFIAAARTRTMQQDGFALCIFTPLKDETRNPGFKGTSSQLYRDTWEPWLRFKAEHPGARWGEVSPGVWVFALSVWENSSNVGGFLPHDRIVVDRAKMIAEGRPLEAAVRYDAEWVDIATDSLIPHESFKFWSEPPRGGFVRIACRIDPAYSAKTASCESAISVWGSDATGALYQIESQHGRWDSGERLNRCAQVLMDYGCPPTTVQRVPGDVVFMGELNRELMRRSGRACVTAHPETGPVPDKVTRAQQFAPMVSNGQIWIRPEHRAFQEQARQLSADFIRRGGMCDVIDAGMGAALMLVENVALAAYSPAVQGSAAFERRSKWEQGRDKAPEWAWTNGRDMRDEVD